jgi:ubiquinone/menaquinone biosynthesis C-methylase UbiE
VNVNEQIAKGIIDSVRTTYNKVAGPFVASRVRDWSEFEIVLFHVQTTDTVLDAGCAHGRLVPALLVHGVARENYTGIDISENLVAKARDTFSDMQFDIGDICNLPYNDNTFDVVISSAVLHHIPSQKLRIQMIQELVRVAKPDGKIILLVWNAFFFKHLWQSIFVSYLKYFFSFGKYAAGDMYLPFFGKENKRYVHAFTKRSLQKLLDKISCQKTILQDTGKNFFILLEK